MVSPWKCSRWLKTKPCIPLDPPLKTVPKANLKLLSSYSTISKVDVFSLFVSQWISTCCFLFVLVSSSDSSRCPRFLVKLIVVWISEGPGLEQLIWPGWTSVSWPLQRGQSLFLHRQVVMRCNARGTLNAEFAAHNTLSDQRAVMPATPRAHSLGCDYVTSLVCSESLCVRSLYKTGES